MKLFLSALFLSQNLKAYSANAQGGTRALSGKKIRNRFLSPTTCEWKIIGDDIDGEVGSQLGSGVSLNTDGSRIAVGATTAGGLFGNPNFNAEGGAKVFERNENDEWVQLGEDIAGEDPFERAGASVSLCGSGNRVAIGAPNNDEVGSYRGQVRVYDYVDESWIQYGQDINGEDSYNDFGTKVHLSRDGMRLIIGAEGADGINGFSSGHARVFADINGAWVQVGQDLDGEAALDKAGSGIAISADGERVAVGARWNDGNGSDSGHTRVYELSDSTWIPVGQDIDGENPFDWSGFDVDLNDDGTRVVIGERYATTENGEYSGQVRVFDEVDGAWVQVGGDIDGENRYDYFGWSVGITEDGNRVAVAAYSNDDGGDGAGHVRVFDYINDDWVQIGQDLDGEDSSNFISRVALSADGSTVAFGASGNEGDGSVVLLDDLYYFFDDYYHIYFDGGHARVFELVEQQCADDSPICARLGQLNSDQVDFLCMRNRVKMICRDTCGLCEL